MPLGVHWEVFQEHEDMCGVAACTATPKWESEKKNFRVMRSDRLWRVERPTLSSQLEPAKPRCSASFMCLNNGEGLDQLLHWY